MPTITKSKHLQELEAKRDKLAQETADLFTKDGSTGKYTMGPDALGEINKRNDAMAKLHDEIKAQEKLENIEGQARSIYQASQEPVNPMVHPRGGDGDRKPQAKSLGQIFAASREYQQFKGQRNWPTPVAIPNLDIRAAVFRTGAGWTPTQIREPGYVPDSTRPIAVVDNIPILPTSADTIRYMREDAITDVAVEKAESTATTAADLIEEATRALTEQTQTVEWLPVFAPVTLQQMEDVDGIEAYLDLTLTAELRRRLDLQILRGTGATPLLLGTNNVGSINTQAKGGDPTPDAIFKAMTKVRGGGATPGNAEPSVVFAHPNDWEAIRLLRTADGLYIWGPPSESGPTRVWGVPVVVTAAALENTMTLGDYATYSALYVKRDVTMQVSDSHAHYFTRGMLAVRLDMRAAMVHRRPTAFATVTGV